MIDEKRLVDLRDRWEKMPGTISQQEGLEMVATLEELWKVARAARRWHHADQGTDSEKSYRDFEKLIKALPPL